MQTSISFYMNKIACLLVLVFLSCSSDEQGFKDFDAGGTKTEAIAGRWFVQDFIELPNGELEAQTGYYEILISNTAANVSNEILISRIEDGDIVERVKAEANIEALTFGVENGQNLDDENDQITITEGKVVIKGTNAPVSKTVVDSISFKFSSTSITTPVIVAGHRRSGFAEDEVVD